MKYRLYLGLIEENLHDLLEEVLYDDERSQFSFFDTECISFEDYDAFHLGIMFAYMFYVYATLQIIRNIDGEVPLDDEDRELVIEVYIEYLSKCKTMWILREYLESTGEDIEDVADDVFANIEELFMEAKCYDSVPYAMAVDELYEDLDCKHHIYVMNSQKIYFDIGVNSDLLIRGAVEIEYD